MTENYQFYSFIGLSVAFLFPLLLGQLSFCFSFERKKNFALRLLVAFIAALTCFWVLNNVVWLIPNAQFFSTALIFFLAFCMTVPLLKFLFREEWTVIILAATNGYIVQYLVSELHSALWVAMWTKQITLFDNQVYRYGAMWLMYASVYAGVCFLRSGKKEPKTSYGVMARDVIPISIAMLVITVLISTVAGKYRYTEPNMFIITSVFSAVVCVFLIFLQEMLVRSRKYRHESEVMTQLWENNRNHMLIREKNMEVINIKCHDLKHYISRLRRLDGEAVADELKELEKAVFFYDCDIDTGNETINNIVMEKSIYCSASSIKLSCMLDGNAFGFLSTLEIYTLFGNLLDNAIEAACKVVDVERRIISITSGKNDGILTLRIENYFDGDIRFENGLLVTSKDDPANHGFGMKSIKAIVSKHEGFQEIFVDGDKFCMVLSFPQAVVADKADSG